ncbi:serine/threonine-protein kinase 11-interacting protein isoform X2 [Aphidius gifuensis]|uniref:serine/threonine-protein kinase 11-interacting protein isoform X2 n=1 Tax=Aphidius gifuensis TaxID=684658 RepID=UPI001CDD3AA7|nr:serine/threonine-protein kinase 11-interacting protein isoform X2 [Aphidius gifuensis]
MSSSKFGMPSMQEILELAKLLRKNGDKVLNGTCKLSLSSKLLHNLNYAFTFIIDDSKDFESSFQVCNSSEIEIFRDLKFLHDFVQKTIWLKITHTQNEQKKIIDITKFRHLRYLELQKICIDLVNGIQGVRGQLESITCTGAGGVGTIGRLLVACGGDAGVGFVWASLNRLVLPYNGLGRLDKSLELAPWLQILDLSHNYLTVAGELNCLPSLKFANLGYNKLEVVPVFNKAAYRTLRVLVLKNNFIDNLNGLEGLDCLAELDLSYNCLSEHSVLWPIEAMSSLQWISLEGNPLSYHQRHRILTMKYLHASLAESKFILDQSPLSKSEKLLVSENRLYTIRSAASPCRDNLSTTPLSTSMISDTTTASIETPVSISSMTTDVVINNTSKTMMKIKKKRNLQEAIIADDDECDDKTIDTSILSASYSDPSTDHLETKKKMLALREKFGNDNWLSSHAGSFVQDIMGIERTTGVVLSSTPSMEASSFIQADRININNETEHWNSPGASSEYAEKKIDDEKTINENTDQLINQIEENSTILEEDTNQQIKSNIETCYDSEDEEGELYLVQKIKNNDEEEMEEIFLIISQDLIKERDSITRKIKYRWSTDSVLSCVMGRGEKTTIDLIFDTARRDRQNRTYFVEPEDAIKIVKTISDWSEKRPILLKVFKCMKCSTHFSQDPDYFSTATPSTISQIKPPTCPSCDSNLVIQTDELLTPKKDAKNSIENNSSPCKTDISNDNNEDNQIDTNLQRSASYSSIGSATSLEESRESTPSANTLPRKCDSDIEILSNPSQSSIEVLDDGTKSTSTPSRKRSSEERRIAVAPSLLTIPDVAPVMPGLTESSSSGSLTDSVCTAYENKNIKNSDKIVGEQNIKNEAEKDSSYTPVANITSMLGGLLESMKIGTTKGSPIKLDNSTELFISDIEYSYTDFCSVDHRIKLHLILNVFEQENEELVLFLRSEILMQNQTRTFPGCIVLSTLKMYVLKIIGQEGDDPQNWLQKEISWTTDRLRTFAPLPFKQGVLIELQQPNKIADESSNLTLMCILQDFQRTSNVLFYLTDLSLPNSCEVEFSIPEQCTTSIHNLMSLSAYHRNGDAVRILALFSSATLKLEDNEKKLNIGGLVITTSSLILTEDKIHWLLPESNETPIKFTEQAISNLIEVIFDESSLGLSFLDEVAGIEELWTLKFVSTGAAEAVVNAIQPPWEELFSVPLQITTKTQIIPSTDQKS